MLSFIFRNPEGDIDTPENVLSGQVGDLTLPAVTAPGGRGSVELAVFTVIGSAMSTEPPHVFESVDALQ